MPIQIRRIAHNWRLKLLALGLAVFLWALVQNEPNLETFQSVPVWVQVADTEWTTAGPPEPATVELRLGGPIGEIARLRPRVVVPVESVSSRDTTITLRRDWVDMGEGARLNVEQVSPSTVHVSFERAVTRAVPAAIRLEGHLSRHLAMAGPVSLNPRMIRIRGAESRVESIDSVPLRPLDLASVDTSGIFTVAVDTTHLAGVRVTPRTAAVELRVEEEIERVLPDVPVVLDSQSVTETLTVVPSSVRVTLSGARTPVTAVDPARLRVRVAADELRGMTPGEERHVPVQVDGVPALVTAAPEQEMVTVRRPAAARTGGAAPPGPGSP